MVNKKILIFLAAFLVVVVVIIIFGLYLLFSYWNNSELQSSGFSYNLSDCRPGEWFATKNPGFDYINYTVVGITIYRNTTVCHAVANVIKTNVNVTDNWYWTEETNYCYNTTTVYPTENKTSELCWGKWPGYR